MIMGKYLSKRGETKIKGNYSIIQTQFVRTYPGRDDRKWKL